jgi:hypothetical protein
VSPSGSSRASRSPSERSRCDFSTCCSHQGAPAPGQPPSSARSGPAALREKRALTGSLVAVLSRQEPLSALLLAHRRQREAVPSPGLTAWRKSRTGSPDAEGSPRGPSKPRWSATAERAKERSFPLQRFRRAAALGEFPHETSGRRVSPRGILCGGAASDHHGNNLLRIDS